MKIDFFPLSYDALSVYHIISFSPTPKRIQFYYIYNMSLRLISNIDFGNQLYQSTCIFFFIDDHRLDSDWATIRIQYSVIKKNTDESFRG